MAGNTTDQIRYNNGTDASNLGSGAEQLNPHLYWKKALVEAARDQYFTQMASVKNMPKHFGKTIKKYHFMPLLDDRNDNDQGIDASGATISDGNLYGSSRDIGTIQGKLPALTEVGGRVNRVGFTRLQLEGTLEKFGFFDEFTQESLDFDTMADLYGHMQREMIIGASQMTEAALQIDLLNAAGVEVYPDSVVAKTGISGETGAETLISYEDLMRLAITLRDNRCPTQTTVITGSRMVDTKTIRGMGFVMYVGSALRPTLEKMTDLHGNPAFIPVNQYGAATTLLRGEVGAIGEFRIVEVPEMLHWAGAGASESTNAGYRATGGKYDVFPMLIVGAESFTTIGFQTSGSMVKFKITTKMPGEATADRFDPYGESGFSSIKWYYGFMVLRPERIATVFSPAEI